MVGIFFLNVRRMILLKRATHNLIQMFMTCSAFFLNFCEQKFVLLCHLDVENGWLGESCAPEREAQAQAFTYGQKQQETSYDAVN